MISIKNCILFVFIFFKQKGSESMTACEKNMFVVLNYEVLIHVTFI